MICPEFPYGGKQIPDETVKFAARLWYVLERVTGMTPIDYTNEFGDPQWVKYREDLRSNIRELISQKPFGDECAFQKLEPTPVSFARIKELVWASGLRNSLLPTGSAREKWAVNAWRKTFGRLE